MASIVDYSQTLDCYKIRICYKDAAMTWICEMYQSEKLWLAMKMVMIHIKYERPPTVMFLKRMLKNLFFCWHLNKLSRGDRTSFKNVYLNIFAQIGHSVSVLGHKQGVELVLHAMTSYMIKDDRRTFLWQCSNAFLLSSTLYKTKNNIGLAWL